MADQSETYTLIQIREIIKGHRVVIGVNSLAEQLDRYGIAPIQSTGSPDQYPRGQTDQFIHTYYPDPSAPRNHVPPDTAVLNPQGETLNIITHPARLDQNPVQIDSEDLHDPSSEPAYRFGFPANIWLNAFWYGDWELKELYDNRIEKTKKSRGHKFRW